MSALFPLLIALAIGGIVLAVRAKAKEQRERDIEIARAIRKRRPKVREIAARVRDQIRRQSGGGSSASGRVAEADPARGSPEPPAPPPLPPRVADPVDVAAPVDVAEARFEIPDDGTLEAGPGLPATFELPDIELPNIESPEIEAPGEAVAADPVVEPAVEPIAELFTPSEPPRPVIDTGPTASDELLVELDAEVVARALFGGDAATSARPEPKQLGRELVGRGRFVRVESYFSDPVFGEHPGARAVVELLGADDAEASSVLARAVVQVPKALAAELRARSGDVVAVRGRLVGHDVFLRELHLADGSLERV